MSEIEMEKYDKVTEYLLTLKPKNIFDAGFGDLKWLSWSQKHHIEFEGVEIDPTLVKKGHEKYPQFKDKLHEGDLTTDILKQFQDKSYDIVLLVEVIEHIKTPDLVLKILKECVRIAKDRVVITTPNCGDEKILREHGLAYLHYTHVATDDMKFTRDKSHRHWIKFTKQNLTELIARGGFQNFKVIEKRPIQILKPVCYDKLWVEIIAGGQ